ncbi:MAG: hypothetical protein RIC55_03675 [Pirellulaceae bacterium]
MTTGFDPYHKWLGIRPEEQPPTHYRLLGIAAFESDADVISNAADQRMMLVRSLQAGKDSALTQKILNEVSAARVCLLDIQRKAAYDARLRANSEQPFSAPAPIVAIRTDQDSGSRRRMSMLPLVAGGVVVLLGIAALSAILIVMTRSDLLVADEDRGDAESGDPSGVIEGAGDTAPVPAPPAQTVGAPSSHDGPSQQETSLRQEAATSSVPIEAGASSLDGDAATPEQAATPVVDSSAVAPPEQTSSAASREAGTSTPPPKNISTPVAKIAVPTPEKLAQAEALVEEIYASKLSSAEDSPEKLTALSTDILREADAPDLEAHNRFALLRKSAAVAVLGGDLAQAWRVYDQLGTSFEIDTVPLKLSAAAEMAAAVRPADETKPVAEQMLALAEQAAADDWAEAAMQLGDAAVKLARRTRDIEFVKSVVARQRAVTEVAERYRREVAPALATLNDAPDDPAANLAVGKYLALVKGNWEQALPRLAKAPEVGPFRLAAEQELDESASRVAVGDRWYELGQAERDEAARDHLLAHAKALYESEVDALSGLTRTRVEKRLADLASLKSERASAPLKNGEFFKFAGTWIVAYGKSGRRYIIDAEGNVTHGERTTKLNATKDGVLLDFGDDKLERLRLIDSQMVVEHFNPTSSFPAQAETAKAYRLEAPPKFGPAELRPYLGKWAIKYTNGISRHYAIAEDGVVYFSEETSESRLTFREGDLVVDFGDGKLERLELRGEQLWVEHYLPPSSYPSSFMLYGIGNRMP